MGQSKITGWEDMAASLTQAFGAEFVEDFCRTLTDQRRAEEELAFSRQRAIAAATERIEQSWWDGLGECHMSLDPTIFWHWCRKEGRECWGDPSFVREFKRDNPEVRVKSKARKTTILRP
jgi:hypothetical protein